MSQEIVCQTCGDLGFPEALNYCIVCWETAEHTYCFEKLPEVLNEDIDWTCEICLSKTSGDSSLDSSVVTVDGGQCDGASEGKTPCLRKQIPDSDQKNASTNTETTTNPSEIMPKRVRKTVTTSAESTADSGQKNSAADTKSTAYLSQSRPKRVRKTATNANTESATDSAQTRSKRVRKTETTNTESSTCSVQTRSKTARKTVAANTRSKVANQNQTRPVVRKRRG